MRRFLCLLAAALPALAQKAPFDVDAMMKLSRISDPQISPDGKRVAFTVQTIDINANKKPRQIWIVGIEGGNAMAITTEGNNERARWMSSSRLAFISDRGGSSQVWSAEADGTGVKQLTSIPTEAADVSVFPGGKRILFVSEVYPDCLDEECHKSKLAAEKESKVKARVYTSLLYRHWTEFRGARRKHLMTMILDGGKVLDITPGNRDVPTFSLGGPDGFAIAPDGKEVCYVVNADNDQALSTNSDLFTVSPDGGDSHRVTINTAADTSPAYSPDGKWLAWRAQSKAGYESDRWRLNAMDRSGGRTINVTDSLDKNVESFTWSPDSQRLFFTVEDRGRQILQMASPTGGGARSIITGNSTVDDMQFAPDGKTMVYTQTTGAEPTELYRVSSSGGAAVALTKINAPLLEQYELKPYDEFYVVGAEGARVHSFILKPPGFNPRNKYPALFLIHGGPQGAWKESFSYRWNPQVFAAAGFVVVMPNPRGSTGFGQKFTDDINNDWGGKVYEDIMASVNYVSNQPYIDSDRLAAAGGSYGGYMMNWMLGHTDKFKALVCHAGVFDLRSMAGETEEVWFPLWEFRGMPWDNPESYQKWSPSFYTSEFKTPTLVIHGELDYRVPVGQGMQLFTALQMKRVPSKMVLFPDEGHWIGKPQNTLLWYKSFTDWIGEWTKKKP